MSPGNSRSQCQHMTLHVHVCGRALPLKGAVTRVLVNHWLLTSSTCLRRLEPMTWRRPTGSIQGLHKSPRRKADAHHAKPSMWIKSKSQSLLRMNPSSINVLKFLSSPQHLMKGGLYHLVGGTGKGWAVCLQLPGHPGMEKGFEADLCRVLSMLTYCSGYLSHPAP